MINRLKLLTLRQSLLYNITSHYHLDCHCRGHTQRPPRHTYPFTQGRQKSARHGGEHLNGTHRSPIKMKLGRHLIRMGTHCPPTHVLPGPQSINAQDEFRTHCPFLQTNPGLQIGQAGLMSGTQMLFTHLKPLSQRGSEAHGHGARTHAHTGLQLCETRTVAKDVATSVNIRMKRTIIIIILH